MAKTFLHSAEKEKTWQQFSFVLIRDMEGGYQEAHFNFSLKIVTK